MEMIKQKPFKGEDKPDPCSEGMKSAGVAAKVVQLLLQSFWDK